MKATPAFFPNSSHPTPWGCVAETFQNNQTKLEMLLIVYKCSNVPVASIVGFGFMGFSCPLVVY